jgi:hypothetical protein
MHATGAKLNSLGQTQQSNLLGIQDPDPGVPVKMLDKGADSKDCEQSKESD